LLFILVRVMTSEEYTQVATMLAKLQPGFLPFDIFQQVARLSTLSIVEIVPLRTTKKGTVEVLLLEREADDPIFAGQLHTPGCVVLSTDTPGSFESAFRRLIHGELGGIHTTEPTYVTQLLHHSGRGMESSHIYWVDVADEPIVGEFYDINHLPDSFMQSQRDFLFQAVASYGAATRYQATLAS
jgi:hypothetical protein